MTELIQTSPNATDDAGPFAPHPGATRQEAAVEIAEEVKEFPHSATYSPEDNKLRLYPAHRLSAEEFERVKAAGFAWAPRQGLFVAGMWTPGREDLLLEMCGSIEPEEMSLAERQAERAERFAGFKARRTADAQQAQDRARSIGQRFEFGQPILVGHHSERRARKDQERMHNAMRAAVNAWETADYWRSRAEGALAHADHKERPDVRARRIKTIEADLRKARKESDQAQATLDAWRKPGLTIERAKSLANYLQYSWKFTLDKFPRELPASQYEGSMGLWSAIDGGIVTDPQIALDLVERAGLRSIAGRARWIAHYENRLAYERAMLGEQIGVQDMSERWPLAVGGRVLVRGEWLTVMRVNKKEGRAVSVSTNARFVRVRGVEEIQDYQAPTEEAAKAVATATSRGKLCNYPDANTVAITQAQWDEVPKDHRGHRKVAANDTHEGYQRRIACGVWLPCPDLPDSLARTNWKHRYHFVFITDAKRVDPPALAAGAQAPAVPAPERDAAAVARRDEAQQLASQERASDEIAQGLQAAKAMAAGAPQAVQVVGAVDLFPTPPELAERVAELAELEPGQRVLEPSAGTGSLVAPALAAGVRVQAVEQSETLAAHLRRRFEGQAFGCVSADFLTTTPEQLGTFDAVVMNPPFGQAADIRHVRHARSFLKPGGRLVAIVAGGPRQAEALQADAELWEPLPPDTFEGTSVRAVLCVFRL